MELLNWLKFINHNKAYITDWGINGVHVLDLNTNTITGTIDCGTGPEGITVANGGRATAKSS